MFHSELMLPNSNFNFNSISGFRIKFDEGMAGRCHLLFLRVESEQQDQDSRGDEEEEDAVVQHSQSPPSSHIVVVVVLWLIIIICAFYISVFYCATFLIHKHILTNTNTQSRTLAYIETVHFH